MVWMAWCTMVSPKSNCQGRKPDSRNEAGRGACRGLSAGMNGYLGPEPLVLNSWWGHFGEAMLGNPAWLGPQLGPPPLKILHCNELHLNETLLNTHASSPH